MPIIGSYCRRYLTIATVIRRDLFAPIALLGSILAVAWLAACSNHQQRDLAVREHDSEWQYNFTIYEQRLAKWLRDSVVIDSIAGTIPRDSVRQVYLDMLASAQPAMQLQKLLCLEIALSRKYGHTPVKLAARQVEESVFAQSGTSASRAMNARFPDRGLLLSTSRCAPRKAGEVVPESLDGTSLMTESPKPVLPKRRRHR